MKTESNKSIESTRILLFAALFAALTAAGALIRIPVPPVPFTLQTFFVYLAAGLLGPKTGFFSQLLYIAIGLSGLPVFTGGGGIAYVLQPQFGYLLGMPAAALLIGFIVKNTGWITGRRRGAGNFVITIRYILAYTAGTLIIYTFGVTYLAFYTRFVIGSNVELQSIIWAGCIIFLPTDLIKITVAALISNRLKSVTG